MSTSEEEEKYFAHVEFERRTKVQRKLDAAAQEAMERRKMAAALNGASESLVDRLRALGFDGETAKVLDILPLVHVAWADGSVAARERAAILQLLDIKGVAANSEGYHLITALLAKRPSEAFLDETLGLLAEVARQHGGQAETVVDLCVLVAEAHQGLFGFGRTVSSDEREMIERIASKLGDAAVDEAHKRLHAAGAIRGSARSAV